VNDANIKINAMRCVHALFIHDIKEVVEDILEMEVIEKIKQNNSKCF
jgi:hypothetical protein